MLSIHEKIVRDEGSFADAVFCVGCETKILGCKEPRSYIMLSVRGTYELGDFLQDLKFKQAVFDHGQNAKVHLGKKCF